MTRWGGCCFYTGGTLSVYPEMDTGYPTACRFGSDAYSYFRLSRYHDSSSSSLTFTRPPSLAPRPPCSWQTPEPILADRLHRLRGSALSGRFRRLLTDSATAPRLWVTEHPVSSASFRTGGLTIIIVASRHSRSITSLSDSRRTPSISVLLLSSA